MIGTVSNQTLSQVTTPHLYKETSFQQTPVGEIPQDWEVRELDSLAEIYDSKRIPLSKMERKNKKGPYPYCGANGIIDYLDDYIFDGEYVLLAEDGGAYGKFENTAYLMGGKFWVNNHAHILKTIEGKASNQFLKTMFDFLDLNFYIVGSTRKKLNQERMRKIKIPTPPLPEQRAVVGVLGVVDSALELADQVIAKCERLKRGLMHQLLTRGIGHTETKQTPIGKIPKEWEVTKIGEAAETSSGGTPSRGVKEYFDGGIPWVKSGELKDNTLYSTEETISKEGLKNSATKMFPKGTLLIALYGATVGKTTILGIDATTNQAICAILPKSDCINPEFLKYFIISRRRQLIAVSAGGAQPNISQEIIQSTYIPLPPIEEQRKIANILLTVDKKLGIEKTEKEKFEKIKQAMMDLLLTGKVRIKVD